jgi:hypothetical protein
MTEHGHTPDTPHENRAVETDGDSYGSFETADEELIIYLEDNHNAFISSDCWGRVPP